ncbi:MAG: hypothetical protein GWN64_07695 [Candidatus Thorarchaeota archaeon]|nr:hypothetical protein [Candidatus Thorarchaeota archaeon]
MTATKPMSEYMDELNENTSPTTGNKHLTKEAGEDPKVTLHATAPEWSSTYTYSADDIVAYGGKVYKSLQNSNLNKNPSTETSWWEDTDTTNNTFPTWSSLVTYASGDFISYSNKIYYSLQNSNLNKNPSSEPTWWSEYPVVAGVGFDSGIIKSSSSVINDSTLSSISDWSGSAGAYTSTITFNSAKAYQYAQKMTFYTYDGSAYHEVFPTDVSPTSSTTVVVTMPVNDDLYLGSI